jgi:hypothetical protein
LCCGMAILPKSLVIAKAGTIERGLIFDDRWLRHLAGYP